MGKKLKKSVSKGKTLASTPKSRFTTDELLYLCLMIIIAIVPLVSHYISYYHISPLITASPLDTGTTNDVFVTYKYYALLIGSALVLLLLLYKFSIRKESIKESYINLPLTALALIILFSGILAYHKSVSIYGNFSNREGALTYFCYLLLFFAATSINFTERKINVAFNILLFFIGVNSLLSVLSFFGADILKIELFRALTGLPLDAISGGNKFNTTLGNEDYLSGISAVTAILFFVRGVLAINKQQFILSLTGTLLSFTTLATAMAKSGYVTLAVMLIPALILAGVGNQKQVQIKRAGIIMASYCLIFIALFFYNPTVLARGLTQYIEDNSPKPVYAATKVSTTTLTQDDFTLPARGWGLGTGRVYIWQETLQLIVKRPLLGYGLDSLQYFFPQNDPQKAAQLYDPELTVDKPHNMYLEIAYGSGIAALAILLLLFGRHARKILTNIKHIGLEPVSSSNLCLNFAWVAFLVQAMFNDTTIGSAVIFWVLFGMSVAYYNHNASSINKV